MKKILIIGSVNLDSVVAVDHTPVTGETILSGDITFSLGGKGANQAYAIGKLGGAAAMLAAVGCDDGGKLLQDNLASVRVDVSCLKKLPDVSTGAAWIAVDRQGNNSIIVIPGANRHVTPDYIDENLALLRECDIVIMQLEIPPETVVHTARLAKELGKTVILDPAPAVKDLPEALYALVDIMKPNESELSILTGAAPSEYEKGARILRQRGTKNVLVSLGSKGVYWLGADGEGVLFPGHPVKAVDTTAAGDSFVGGLAVALASGATLHEAIKYGQKVAAIAVTRKGAQSSIPSKEEVGKPF